MANVLETSMNYLQTQDPEVAACIENEFQRQKQNIELIASENIASPAVIAAMGSVLTNKYAEGYPGKRYYGGCDYVDVLETIAIERAKSCSARLCQCAATLRRAGKFGGLRRASAAGRYAHGHGSCQRRPSDARCPRQSLRQIL